MTIEIPGAVQWLVPIVVGTDWPEGDEDALRRMAEAWTTAASDTESVLGDTDAAVQAALGCMQGQTADAFTKFGQDLTSGDSSPLEQLRQLCEGLGEGCDSAALEVEYTKLSIIAALVILAAQIAAMVASAAATFGASTAGIPIAQAATQVTVRTIFQQLVKHIVVNVGVNVAVDGGIQLAQAGAGNRDKWDAGKTGSAVVSGVAAGLAAGTVDGAAGVVGNKLGTNLMNPVTSSFTEAAAYGTGKGALSGSLGNLYNDGLRGELASGNDLLAGGTSGAVGGALGGMSDRHQGLDQTWNHDGLGPDYVSGHNTQGWRFQTDEGSVVGANVDNPYTGSFNSSHAEHIPSDGGPNSANGDDPELGNLPSAPSETPDLDLSDGPRAAG